MKSYEQMEAKAATKERHPLLVWIEIGHSSWVPMQIHFISIALSSYSHQVSV